MGEFHFNENEYRSSGSAQSEVERDGFIQSVVGYYRSGPGHEPQPEPAGYEVGSAVPGGSGVRVAIFAAIGIAIAILQLRSQI